MKFFKTKESHKAIMMKRKKSTALTGGEHFRRAEEHPEMITNFKGKFWFFQILETLFF